MLRTPLSLVPRFDPLIERLQNSRVHRRDHIDGGVQLFFGHPRFPCVRKAPVHSGIAQPHHRHGESHEHLLALGQTLDGVGVFVELSKVGFFGCHCQLPSPFPLPSEWARVKLETRNSGLETHQLRRLNPRNQRVGKTAPHMGVVAVGMPAERDGVGGQA